MKYKLALVTNRSLRHLYWVSQLYENHDVKLIIHPKPRMSLIDKFKSKVIGYGFSWAIIKIISLFYNMLFPKSMLQSIKNKELKYFNNYKKKYSSIPKKIIKNVSSVNSSYTVGLIKDNDIDIICFLGGEIAKSALINSPNLLCLNYHSGISPFYNGNKTIFNAVADNRPNFSGGTLMKMSERIDGGEILSHFLPSIAPKDTAADLFCKSIIGSVTLINCFLSYLGENDGYHSIKQKRSFRYFKNIDWVIANDLKLSIFEKSKKMRWYAREEIILNYYNLKNTDPSFPFRKLLNKLLGKK